ncbi:hypothetical protein SERLADRAFT_414563 [Serpula lacrymans var. lacrymans S7.9]|uniref:Cytochrome P450 n=1 Tax=Serpula lacrymans var. lacrymans (strain S7.9) TaxID=578457 RepID=F8NQJ2_SERL9|nr:uncharacterized protein SERLADRAFT_414563 [Serpula lacrymans var. lacrymans S7.9]EGO26598.1 hypothetical protein SERLADRAFT_414563 [Serpula lacrymans var. lacrymans S7.9]
MLFQVLSDTLSYQLDAMLIIAGTVVALVPAFLLALYAHNLSTERVRSPARTTTLPGPPGYPIIGNLFQLGKCWSETFRLWGFKYGEVFAVRLGERDVVIINTPRAAMELLEKQGGAYISRPYFTHFTIPWDGSLKARRKAAATAMNKPGVQSYTPIIEYETLAALKDLLEHGKEYIDPNRYFQRLGLNISLFVNYGTRMGDIDSELFQEIVDVSARIGEIRSVTSSLVDYLPILRIIPNSSRNLEAKELAARRTVFLEKMLDDLLDRIKDNTDVPCIMGHILRDPEAKLDRTEQMSICNTMVSASLDTFSTTMLWMTSVLAQRPEMQEKAYRDIVSSHAGGPLDPFSEKSDFVLAIVKETSRYYSIVRLALPKATIADSEWQGHRIQAGTTVFLNVWACNMNEELFGDPWSFRPERYIEKQESDAARATYAFGAGRRKCPGMHLGIREMYVTCMYIVYYFRLEKARENIEGSASLHPVEAIDNYNALTMMPKQFKVKFVPREENLERLKHVLSNEKFPGGKDVEV